MNVQVMVPYYIPSGQRLYARGNAAEGFDSFPDQ